MKRLWEYEVNESLKEVTLNPVSRLDLIKYAGASGDFNPIHTIDEEALKSGLPGVIAHGMWTMGNLAKLFTPYYNEGFLEDYQIRFSNMVFLEDILTLKASIKEKNETDMLFQIYVINQHGENVLRGSVKFRFV
ncbi:MaoC/PaaZ C-terminal domain-containing protein [Salirhabdus sp. Marseille-P4669]|uniref:MaoC/PaaZ C-terminal domain-containing protein n=1 Tax=Salirhabdus sp. Marseille-P4669 TaxID=2042310 RepID=UPI000C7E401C|nr:MaoC/PaaZ C-terminal domain-containing protein [Salirhabdus sp. Marseille-P4669]